MKYFSILISLLVCSKSLAGDCTEYDSYTEHQKYTLDFAYKQGAPYDLAYTMMAISMKESSGGLYLVNAISRDFGVFGIKLKYAAIRDGIKSNFKKNRLAQELVFNAQTNAGHAIDTLLTFKRAYKGNWKKTVASYKAGWDYSKGLDYQKDISRLVKLYQSCYKKP